MFIVIVGCGKVGVNTARSLLHMGHEVIVIEQRKSRYDLLVEELGESLMFGDGTEIWVLEKAGIAVDVIDEVILHPLDDDQLGEHGALDRHR